MLIKPRFCASTAGPDGERETASFRGSWSSVEDSQTSKTVIRGLCFDAEGWELWEHVSGTPNPSRGWLETAS